MIIFLNRLLIIHRMVAELHRVQTLALVHPNLLLVVLVRELARVVVLELQLLHHVTHVQIHAKEVVRDLLHHHLVQVVVVVVVVAAQVIAEVGVQILVIQDVDDHAIGLVEVVVIIVVQEVVLLVAQDILKEVVQVAPALVHVVINVIELVKHFVIQLVLIWE